MTVFAGLSTLGAVGLLTVLVGCSAAALGYARARRERTAGLVTGPLCGVVTGVAVLAVMVANLDSMLPVAPGSPLVWLVPGCISATAVGGAAWALWLRTTRPHVYTAIGTAPPGPLAVVQARLAALDV